MIGVAVLLQGFHISFLSLLKSYYLSEYPIYHLIPVIYKIVVLLQRFQLPITTKNSSTLLPSTSVRFCYNELFIKSYSVFQSSRIPKLKYILIGCTVHTNSTTLYMLLTKNEMDHYFKKSEKLANSP